MADESPAQSLRRREYVAGGHGPLALLLLESSVHGRLQGEKGEVRKRNNSAIGFE